MVDTNQQFLFEMKTICPVTEAMIDDFHRYAQTLKKWNKKINLVAHSTIDDIWHRHFLDSAQLWPHIPPHAKHWADLGSGAGFPGLVIAILAKYHAPDLRITLIESDIRKSVFLRTVARESEIKVDIKNIRLEMITTPDYDGIMARALAPLPVLLPTAQNFLLQNGTALFLKGQNYAMELEQARQVFDFTDEVLPSKTDSNARMIKITDLKAKV